MQANEAYIKQIKWVGMNPFCAQHTMGSGGEWDEGMNPKLITNDYYSEKGLPCVAITYDTWNGLFSFPSSFNLHCSNNLTLQHLYSYN